MGKKFVKVLALTVCIALVCGCVGLLCAFFGNPISSALAKSSANRYLEENFPDSDFEITKIGYDPKSCGYYVKIQSPTSIDSHFNIYFDLLGRYSYDNYDNITNGGTTFSRVYLEYWDLVEAELADCPMNITMSFGELRAAGLYDIYDYTDENGQRKHYTITGDYGLDMSTLVLDGEYNVCELGREYGRLNVYIEDPEVSLDRAVELLLEFKAYMDQNGIGFHAVEFNLRKPKNEDGQIPDDQIRLIEFLYSDIYEEGLLERVQASWNIAQEHSAIQNGEKINSELIYLKEFMIPEE